MKIHEIINELNLENGSNYKIDVLRKHKDNELLQRVLKMTYDKVAFTYGISMKNVQDPDPRFMSFMDFIDLEEQLDRLIPFTTREITGNAAIKELEEIFLEGSEENAQIIKGIINRDLRINMGRSNINKVFKNLITKPPYMRCGIYNEKTAKKINFPAYVQLKADGTYRYATVDNGKVTFNSRSGEEYNHPVLEDQMKNLPDGIYIGELTVAGIDNRAEGNGLINSDNPPNDKIIFDVWDYVTLEEFSRPKDKKNKTHYVERFEQLKKNLVYAGDNIRKIEYHVVNNLQEALKHTQNWMSQGLEGAILKDYNNIFVDHTSPTQLKLKLEIDAEVRITGFIEGKKGTKREKTFGSITFETDDGKVKGSTSGFTDKQLEEFNSRRDELIGKVMTVQFNDLSKSVGNDFYALSHPRFVEIREDRNTTDTLERIQESKEMATTLGA